MVSGQQDGKYFSFEEYNHYKSKIKESYEVVDHVEYEELFKNVISVATENKMEILENCYILKNYLRNFKNDHHCSHGKCCSYMNYWLNKKIRKNENNLVESEFDVYNDFIEYYNGRTAEKLCESNKFFISNSIYEEMKKLYSLYELYNISKTNSANIDRRCRELNTCVIHYNKIVPKCKENRDTKFCKALQNFKINFSQNESKSISECKKTFGELKLKEPEELSEEETQPVNFLYFHWSRGSEGPELSEDSLYSEPRRNAERVEESIHVSSFSLSTVIQTLFFSAVGISLLFLLSYKFTPFGKWMRSLLLKKNIIKHYETEETQDILSHTYENANIDTEDSVHNIQYYATQNS
ncbi:PIR Superfamily Protein [Plasmodium ovale curtisi]|uniref:PIR Superfamily Protein n=1 Tax=Plasmodium ovale curtisi TaxID=864141 RepID=A0A1A8XD42_PLAOA|nr:PIR Superfamily Protein [Plasmodium ovale curtisi]